MASMICETPFEFRGSDNELAYASPVLPHWKPMPAQYGFRNNLPPSESIGLDMDLSQTYSSEIGFLGPDARKRRYLGCIENQVNFVDGFIKEVFRAGGPYLCSIPIKTYPDYRPSKYFPSRVWAKGRLMLRIREILENNHITTTQEPMFVGRRSVFNPEPEPVFTFLVYSEDAGITCLGAALEIYDFLFSEDVRDFSVEICHPRHEEPRQTLPILERDSISTRWEEVRNVIVDSINLEDVMIVGCYRRGRSKSVDGSLPTVLIVVESTSTKRDWRETREAIVDILFRFNFPDVAVEIVKDELRSGPSTTGCLSPVVLSGMAKGGESIAPCYEESGAWTLGGFVEIKSPLDQKWHIHGLTCFHCVMCDPATLQDFPDLVVNKMRIWCREGIRVDDVDANQLLVDHPATSALENERQRTEREIHSIIPKINEEESYTTVKGKGKEHSLDLSLPFRNNSHEIGKRAEDIMTFTDGVHQTLGPVAAGSGFGVHVKRPSRRGDGVKGKKIIVDWALIELEPGRWPTNAVDSGFIQQIPEDMQLDLSQCRLYMQGHGSGHQTEGHYNPLQDYIIDRRLVTGRQLSFGTIASSVLGADGAHFSADGDTGAFVLTKDKFLVGMVNCRTRFNHITYFMHIEDIFSHILETTGMEGVRVYNG